MIHFYIRNRPGLGYVVMKFDDDTVPSERPVRCFGYRQSDAIEFRDDCRKGKIDDRRIKGVRRHLHGLPVRLPRQGESAESEEG